MKKKLLAVVAACACLAISACVLAGCGSSGPKDGKLIVGFDAEYPPYGYMDENGSYTGFDLELAKAVADKNGWAIEFKPIDWDAKDSLIESGAITCIWNGFTMEGREDKYTFSEAYMLNSQVIVVKKGAIADEAGLAGKNVVTQAGSAAEEVLIGEDADKADLAKTFGSLTAIAEYNTAFMSLEAGLVDAVACDYSIAMYQMSAKPDAYSVLTTLSEEHYGVGFKKGESSMAKAVSDTLKTLTKDGTVEKLINKYADQGLSMTNWCIKAS